MQKKSNGRKPNHSKTNREPEAEKKLGEDEHHGIVIEAMPNTMFKLKLEDGTEQIGYLAGKMRMHRIRVLIGDKVIFKSDPYGGKARIFKRL